MKKVLAVLLLVVGCSSVARTSSEPVNAVVAKQYAGAYDRLLVAARGAIDNAGLTIATFVEHDSTTATILAERPQTQSGFSELVRVVVEQTTPDSTVVRVLTHSPASVNGAARSDYSDRIFAYIDRAVR
jgi:hypothetical protein